MEIETENIETTEREQEEAEGKEEENTEEKEDMDPILSHATSPQDTSMSPNSANKEVVATLTTLSTPVKTKRKR